MFHDFDEREMLKHRDNVRESLMEGQTVRLSHLYEPRMDAVEDGVSGFVRDDVVG